MRTLFLSAIIWLLPFTNYAQTDSVKVANISTYQDLVMIDKINSLNVFATDTFNVIVQHKLKHGRYTVDDNKDHPKVYFTNKIGNKYLEIWSGPDLGYGWFYTIGYIKNGKCTKCGTYLGPENTSDFITNLGVKLGDDIKEVWPKVHLEYFRNFSFMGIKYFYFEKGIRHEVPFTPNQIFFYKFKDEKLIEIGFGYGMIGVNPMLESIK